jgi:uncharacterized protein YukE
MSDFHQFMPSMPVGAQERARLNVLQMVQTLESATVPAERAELAAVVAGEVAKYENAKTYGLYPMLRHVPGSEAAVERAEEAQGTVRLALVEMHHKTRHVKPINAHVDDPDGFEQSVGKLIESIHVHMNQEDQELLVVEEQLDPREISELADHFDKALAHPSTLPEPPHNPIRRMIAEWGESLEHAFSDESTRWHPAAERLTEVDGVQEARDTALGE